jgi:hypothetical protein
MDYFTDQMANATYSEPVLAYLSAGDFDGIGISRTFVAGTRYSPILIIVVFGLIMGYVLVSTGMGTPGLREFPIVDFTSKVTITALIASFFVGGRKSRKYFPIRK